MALPALADVVRGEPDTTIDLAARAAIAPLAPLVPGIERTVLLGSRRDSVAAVRAGHYDAVLLFTNSFNTAWMASLTRSAVPTGTVDLLTTTR